MHKQINTNIAGNLTDEEREVFDVLNKVVATKSPGTTLRVAGGWVRDKLMGIPSNDIDIMTDNVTGEQFANMVVDYMGLEKSPHVIRENPEKTKNIASAKLYIPLTDGTTQELDFVQARTDKYEVGVSRVPITKPGTPEEDAMRRDLTINALFYNLQTKQVEDKTGQGIKDLMQGVIRTPGDPRQRFLEDPLRVFRTVRFAAKYDSTIDPETLEAMKDPEVVKVLHTTSPDRIGQEIKKMIVNPNTQKAIQLLHETGLMQYVMSEALRGTNYEGKMAEFDMDQNNPNHELSLWEHTMQVLSGVLDRYQDAEDEKRIAVVLGTLFHDVGKLFNDIRKQKEGTDKYPGHEGGYTTYIGHEKESELIVQHILKFLKLDSYVQQAAGLARYHMQPHSLERGEAAMKAMRKFIRRMGEASLNWLDVLNISIADAYAKNKTPDPAVVARYEALERDLQAALVSLSPDGGEQTIEPVLNGNEIMQALNVKPGPWMRDMTEFVRELRDENPNITKEEAVQKLQERYPQQNEQDLQNVTAKSQAEREAASGVCPNHLFESKYSRVLDLMSEDKEFEAMSVLAGLKDDYGDDERISRLTAVSALKAMIKDPKLQNNNLLEYVFAKAEHNFFDSVLGSYVTGILILIKTDTDPTVIREMGSRMSKLSPGLFRSVVEMLPKEKVYQKDLYKAFKNETLQVTSKSK